MSDKGPKLEEARIENVLSSRPSGRDAQGEYYQFKLRQEKLANALQQGRITGQEAYSLTGISELDQLELKALSRLYQLSDNSPELLQYFAITKCSSREEVAKKLAKKQLRKQLVEEAVNKVLDPERVKDLVSNSLTYSRDSRSAENGLGLGRISVGPRVRDGALTVAELRR